MGVERFQKLSKVALQLIAIAAMTIDHVALLLFPGYPHEPLPVIMHVIGSMAFPIFAFFIAEGYHYTRNKNRYMLRLFLLALVSHVPYMFGSNAFREYGPLCFVPFATGEGMNRFLNQSSVLLPYLIGLLMLRVNDSERFKAPLKVFMIVGLCLLSFPFDWSCIGSLTVFCIAVNRGKPLRQILWPLLFVTANAAVCFFTLDKVYGLVPFGAVLSLPLLAMYNGQKSKRPVVATVMQPLSYLYYPLHLTVIGIISLFL